MTGKRQGEKRGAIIVCCSVRKEVMFLCTALCDCFVLLCGAAIEVLGFGDLVKVEALLVSVLW